MIQRDFDAISARDLETLIENGVAEGRTIDYKQSLPGSTDSDKKEFVADVTSFANTIGGDLVFGVDEKAGAPTGIVGVDTADRDEAIRRIDGLLGDGADPRFRYRARWIECGPTSVLLLRVERSWIGPHRVVLKGHDKFYARNSAGKYPMDVTELRQAFLASATIYDRIRSFRRERLELLRDGAAPVRLPGTGRIVLHLIPLSSFTGEAISYDVHRYAANPHPITPMTGTGNWRINLDGVLTWSIAGPDSSGYTQLFRSGSIEAVDARLPNLSSDNTRAIPSTALEKRLLEYIPKYLAAQREIGVEGPVFVFISLIGVAGCRLQLSQSQEFYHSGEHFPFDGDVILPEVLIAEDSTPVSQLVKPALDLIWNACGFVGSLNFKPDGTWQQPTG